MTIPAASHLPPSAHAWDGATGPDSPTRNGPRPGVQKVIVHDGSREIHGYAIARAGALVDVVWAVFSGRLRRRTFSLEQVYLPGTPLQWAGLPVPQDKLHALAPTERRTA